MHNNKYNSNSIILLGYMGSGKSTVGKELAKNLNLPFKDLDSLIAAQYQTTIPHLFQQKGAKTFRHIEHKVLMTELRSNTPIVLSLGGGTPCYYNNMSHVLTHTPNVFYLKASPSSLASRLFEHRVGRPLIAHLNDIEDLQQFIAKHLFDRQPFYSLAPNIITVDGKTVRQLVSSITSSL